MTQSIINQLNPRTFAGTLRGRLSPKLPNACLSLQEAIISLLGGSLPENQSTQKKEFLTLSEHLDLLMTVSPLDSAAS